MIDKKEIKDPLLYIPKYFRVITKADESGNSELVPMVLWPTQKHFIANKGHRNIAVKNRQTGFSSGELADDSHKLFTKYYQRASIITHDHETSEFLFQTVQRFYRNLPWNVGRGRDEMEPKTDWRSGSRMRFPILDSYIYIDSAKSDSLGIGHTLNIAHLSEVAKWPPRRAEELFADISQTVPKGGFITLESTPKGRGGLFYRLYVAAKKKEINYKHFFYPWWWDITCFRPVEKKLELTKEESALVSNFNLTDPQIAFRREKIAELGDLFYQEYPENDVDCWMSSEISVFDGVAIRYYLQQIQEGRQDGNLTIWKGEIGGEKYIIGADVAAGLTKGDYSVASVLNNKRNEYVARLRGRIPPDIFAQELLKLGYRYNEAIIAVEASGHGHTVLRILMENNYPNIYYKLDYDEMLGGMSSKPGWRTDRKTKPIMIDTFGAYLRSNSIVSWSENLMTEASGLTWEGNTTRTPTGGFDDELDAVMIALQVREQEPIESAKQYKPTSYASL